MAGRVRAAAVAGLLCIAAASARGAETERVEIGGAVVEFALVKAGTFQMGSPEGEEGRRPDEVRHEARIAQDFWIGIYPVTKGQFTRFVEATRYRTEAETGTSGGYGVVDGQLVQRREFTWRNPGFPQRDDHPVVMMTVRDANAFIVWANGHTGRRFYLPTEAQWEYACRAGTETRFYSGETDADAEAIAWFRDNAGGAGVGGTHPVGEKKANAWGIFDMSGNVWEWCSDRYGPYRPGGPVVGDMNQPRNVLRGGSFLRGMADVRSAARYRNAPASRNADNGFRLVMAVRATVPATPPPAAAVNRGRGAPTVNPPAQEPIEIEPTTPPADQASPPPQMGEGAVPGEPRRGEQVGAVQEEGTTFHALLGGMCLLAPCAVLGVIGVVIFMVVKRMRGGGATGDPMQPLPVHPAGGGGMSGGRGGGGGGGDVPPRAVQDGFWVNTAGYAPGQRVGYRYRGPGGMVEDEFVVEPGSQGQFIYTGVTPMDIALLGMMGSMNNPPQPPPIPRQTPRRNEGRSRGYPSAY